MWSKQKTERTLRFWTVKYNPGISRNVLPNYNGNETLEEKYANNWNNEKLDKKKVRAELQ